MINPGEIYWADADSGARPVVVVSREELNRGHWVVIVPITTGDFARRSLLPNCVPFRAGEFGLPSDSVAQAEAITDFAVSDLDLDAGPLGVLDESRMRDLIRAVGDMMGSDCEPQ